MVDAYLRRQHEDPVSDDGWGSLLDDETIEELLDSANGDVDVAHVAETVRERRRLGQTGTVALPPLPPDANGSGEHAVAVPPEALSRRDALSAVLAADAAEDDDVRAFRRQVLRGRLLRADKVAGWIERRARRDGEVSHVVEMTVDTEATERLLKAGRDGGVVSVQGRARSFQIRLLSYPDSGYQWTNRVPVNLDGVLGRLRSISEGLASRYGWQEAQATAYVLTGSVPLVVELQVSISTGAPCRAAIERVTLVVDPTVAPSRVDTAYREARSQLLGKRYRACDGQTYELAAFTRTRSELSWDQRRQEWNREHPSRQYDDLRQFRTLAARAQRRLVRD